MTATQLPPELVANYRLTLYTFAHPDGLITMHVDRLCPELATLYREHGFDSLAFITACNPLGTVMSDEKNAIATSALGAELSSLDVPIFSGTGIDSAGLWHEASFAVPGMSLIEARRLGERWRQNAIVWADADAIPRLALLR